MRLTRRLRAGLLDAAAVVLAPVLSRLRVRFVPVDAIRIGEAGAGLGWFVQARELGWVPPMRPIGVTFPRREPANPTYIDYWRRYLPIATGGVLHPLAFRLMNRGLAWPVTEVTTPTRQRVVRDSALIASQSRWEAEKRRPLLELSQEHRRRGTAVLAGLGLPADAWFVALHVRESGYLLESPDSHRLTRNADPFDYLPATRRIVDDGGWVIRLGDPSMKPLPPIDGVLDYVHSRFRSDWMDVFLAASCRFFLGTSSGMFVVASSFGRPCALANWDSLVRRPWARHDLFIPKLWWVRPEGRHLTFREAVTAPLVDELYGPHVRPSDLARLGISPVDSSAEDIVDLVEEMLGIEHGAQPSAGEVRLRRVFEDVVADHFPDSGGANIGARFLARHSDLLPSTVD